MTKQMKIGIKDNREDTNGAAAKYEIKLVTIAGMQARWKMMSSKTDHGCVFGRAQVT